MRHRGVVEFLSSTTSTPQNRANHPYIGFTFHCSPDPLIDTALDDTREHIATLTKVRTRPHVLDDATIDRIQQVHTEQMEFVDIYAQQISRWQTQGPSAPQARELVRMNEQNGYLRAATAQVFALACELRKRTIERVIGMSDVELCLQALLGSRPDHQR